MKAKLPQQNIKQIIAGSLIIWLSGIVFLFCCDMPDARASNVESCPLVKTQHCSRQSDVERISDFAALQKNQPAFDCCEFLALVFDKARKIERIQKTGAAQTNVKFSQPLFSVLNRRFSAAKNLYSVVIDRENTRLKNCVFRI